MRGPLRLGSLEIPVPVFLAPMAGVTNSAYRTLCREQAELGSGGVAPAGVFTCEMITARGVAERIDKTFAMMAPDEGDSIMSVQLYGTDPAVIAHAVSIACGERGVRHVDINFGCPVPKVTRRGGGGVLPWKVDRLEEILVAAVSAARPFHVPVTVKTRIGVDADHVTMFDTAKIAEHAGVAAVTLHARTVEQAYSGQARWDAISELVAATSVPIIGNGDVWEASDAVDMMEETGCAGVAIGRGALGRPWLFRDLADALTRGVGGVRNLPSCGDVAAMVRRHAELLVAHFHDERHAMADLRKHMAWYFKGFGLGGDVRYRLGMVSSLTELSELLGRLDGSESFPERELSKPRGRQGSPRRKVAMPYGWLESRYLNGTRLADVDGGVNGG